MSKLSQKMSETLAISEVQAMGIEQQFRNEAFLALCFLCKDEGEPVSTDKINWNHEHKGADGKVYSKSACRANQLRAYYSREDQEFPIEVLKK